MRHAVYETATDLWFVKCKLQRYGVNIVCTMVQTHSQLGQDPDVLRCTALVPLSETLKCKPHL
jgi:hypothetical protein